VRSPVLLIAAALAIANAAQPKGGPKRTTWADVVPLHRALEARGIAAGSFDSLVERIHDDNIRRVRQGDLDHLVFYALQSTRFTKLAPIEPALSAKALIGGLAPGPREAFLESQAAGGRASVEPAVPSSVRARITAFADALDSPSRDPRMAYFQSLARAAFPEGSQREAAIRREYLRVMRFIYQKEFVARRAGPDAVTELYRERGLSTDTAVEAGYVVYNGLGVLQSLDPGRRIRRVLIVGPGLDLAPRTGFLETGPPESYEPWEVIDALLSLGLSRADDLEVVGADINPRVVEHLVRSHVEPPMLTLVSGLRENDTVTLTPDYRDYFSRLGDAIGKVAPSSRGSAPRLQGHLTKTLQVDKKAAGALGAATLDIVTERLDAPAFDLIIATNILPYFADVELMLAISNIAGMLAPGGVFLHNEGRVILGEITEALGLPYEQSRHVTIASVRGAPAPLVDSVWLHRKVKSP
jgi:hypothetical protein